ncbi:hypothetical protein Q9L58_002819 [Maublancomyces gigas]|uniref:Uncharacterized protein n=1 Tax=Discina gigas TaxID=1032678 RepID=A0ABR3GQK3_9PEZI
MSSKPTYPLYNTTYTLHRLSPLHAFPALTSTIDLTHHAKSLLSILRGDVLRGVRVRDDNNDDNDALSRAGKLKSVTWESLPSPSRWLQEPDDSDSDPDPDTDADTHPQGIVITFVYEKSVYTSLLLLSHLVAPATEVDEFTSLPLLLTRLPKSLRATLLSYLASTFDTLPLPLPLDSGTLKKLLEAWLECTFSDDDKSSSGGVGKDIQIVFSAPVASLKAITITVPRADVGGFFHRGKRMVAAGEGEEGEGAFFGALRHYTRAVMGLDIAVLGVMKIACGGFVLGVGASETAAKVKVFPPRAGTRAAEGLVRGLVETSLVATLK